MFNANLNTKAASIKTMLVASIFFSCLLSLNPLIPFDRASDFSVDPKMVKSSLKTAIGRHLHVQKYEITVDQWNRCFEDGACQLKIRLRGNVNEAVTPATGLNWFDVQQYLAWINFKSSHSYRLPTIAEWSTLAEEVLPKKSDSIFTDPEMTWASAYSATPQVSRKLLPIGSFKSTDAGIFDLNGNVWEWTSDCYAGTLNNVAKSKCPAFFVGGEHLATIPIFTRDPARGGCAVGAPPAHLGLRLVLVTSAGNI